MKTNIEKQTINNSFYRKVLFTTKQLQLVLMSIPKDVEIGEEIHENTTQFFRIETGTGVAYINDKRYNLKDGDALIVPANTKHNIRATSDLKLYTIYSPPEHSPNKREKYKH